MQAQGVGKYSQDVYRRLEKFQKQMDDVERSATENVANIGSLKINFRKMIEELEGELNFWMHNARGDNK